MFTYQLYLFFATGIAAALSEDDQRQILKFKTDVDTISNGFENLIFDAIDGIVKDAQLLINADYDTDLLGQPVAKNKLNSLINKEAKTMKDVLGKIRSKRSADTAPVTSLEPPTMQRKEERPSNFMSKLRSKEGCKVEANRTLERRKMDELKNEIKNLQEIVKLLSDQQKVMSVLGHEKRDIDQDFAQRFDKKDLLRMLEELSDRNTNEIPEHDIENAGAIHEELDKLKLELQKAVHTLNKTREIISYEKKIEHSLEAEIKRHRTELNMLKIIVEKILLNGTNIEDEPVLGASQNHKNGSDHPTVRASRMESWRRLLQGATAKQHHPEDLLTRLLGRLNQGGSRKELDDDAEFLRILQLALKLVERSQGRIDDTESELKRLQNAIDTLKPKDDVMLPDNTFIDREQLRRLQDLLRPKEDDSPMLDNRLLNALLDGLNTGAGSNKGPTQSISSDRLNELIKLLQQANLSNGLEYSGDFGTGPAVFPPNRYPIYRPPFPPYTPPANTDYKPTWIAFTPSQEHSFPRPNYQEFESPIYRPPSSIYRPPASYEPYGPPPPSIYTPPAPPSASLEPQEAPPSNSDGYRFFPGGSYQVPPPTNAFPQETNGGNAGETSRVYQQTDMANNMNMNVPPPTQNHNRHPSTYLNVFPPSYPPEQTRRLVDDIHIPDNRLKKHTRRSLDNSELPDVALFDLLTKSLKDSLLENPVGYEVLDGGKENGMEDLKAQLDRLRTPSDPRMHLQYNSLNSPTYSTDYYGVHPLKQNLFTKIVLKILDKVLNAVPAVIERLFGRGIYELLNFNDYNDHSYGSRYEVLQLFRSMGVLGYVPLLLLKIIDGFATFVNILKKNSFFRTFLLPAVLLLIIAGSVIFLIWWMQPDRYDYIQYQQNKYDQVNYKSYNDDQNKQKYVTGYNQGGYNYNMVNKNIAY